MPSKINFSLVVILTLMFGFIIGAKVGKETTESDMYHRDRNICLEELPMNLDCVATEVLFKEVLRED